MISRFYVNHRDGTVSYGMLAGVLKDSSLSALFEALLMKDDAEAQRLLRTKHNLNESDSTGWTPLMMAAAHGSLTIVKDIVRAGVDVNKGDSEGFTPLISAASAGRTEAVRFLIQNGAVVDFADAYGRTALSWAVTKGDFDSAAKVLIEAGADVNKADGAGFTPLMRSALTDHPRCFALLVAQGADVSPVNPEWRKTALDMATERGSDALKGFVRKLQSKHSSTKK